MSDMTKEAINAIQVEKFLTDNYKSSMEYWLRQPTDNPLTLNGFAGTWQFTDHRYIPESIVAFLEEYYYSATRLERIDIEEINKLMNEVWQGPGSMPIILERTFELANARRSNSTLDPATVLKDVAVRSIDDYDA